MLQRDRKKKNRSIGIVFLLTVCLFSCVTTKKTTYLQEYRNSEIAEGYIPPENYLIKPNDNLYVRVSTPDPRWSEIFNPTMGGAGGMSMGGDNISLISYTVQDDGNVYLPYLDAVRVSELTLIEAKIAIEAVLVDFISDASVSVRLVENYVTILGEVIAPGMYSINKDRLNVFQAIALAGDLDDFGNRREVSIIRQTKGESEVIEFDLTDINLVDSEYYYIYPNDIIYVKPIKGRFFGLSQYPYGFILSSLATAVSVFILIQNQLILQQ